MFPERIAVGKQSLRLQRRLRGPWPVLDGSGARAVCVFHHESARGVPKPRQPRGPRDEPQVGYDVTEKGILWRR